MKLQLRAIGNGFVGIAVLSGTMKTFQQEPVLLSALQRLALARVQHVLVDIRRVDWFTYPGICCLAAAEAWWTSHSGAFALVGPSSNLYLPALFQLVRRFDCYGSIEEAVCNLEFAGDLQFAA